jgi:hypothetical protein
VPIIHTEAVLRKQRLYSWFTIIINGPTISSSLYLSPVISCTTTIFWGLTDYMFSITLIVDYYFIFLKLEGYRFYARSHRIVMTSRASERLRDKAWHHPCDKESWVTPQWREWGETHKLSHRITPILWPLTVAHGRIILSFIIPIQRIKTTSGYFNSYALSCITSSS